MRFTEPVIDLAEEFGVEPESVIAADLFMERVGELSGEEINDLCLILVFDSLPEKVKNGILERNKEGMN